MRVRLAILTSIAIATFAFVTPMEATAKPRPSKSRKKKRAKSKAAKTKVAKPAPAPTPERTKATKASEDTRELQRGERVEFDARLIQGQTAKAGAVYLFERVSSNLRSMVDERSSFSDKIVRPVFPRRRTARGYGKATTPKRARKGSRR